MAYCTGSHTKFYHRYHIVWVTKYRFKVLQGEMCLRLAWAIMAHGGVYKTPANA